MADNFAATPGAGLTIAADEIDGVKYPRVKIAFGADGFATDLSSTDPLPVSTGAVDNGAAGQLFTMGAYYASSPEDAPGPLNDQQAGLLRSTAMRVLLTAVDYKEVFLEQKTPVPDHSDITNLASSDIVEADLLIADTNEHTFVIPMAVSGWRNLTILVLATDVIDEIVTWTLSACNAPYVDAAKFCTLASAALPDQADNLNFAIGNGATGQGGVVGDGTTADQDYYNVPAIVAGWGYLCLTLQASSAPTQGEIQLTIMRTT